MAFRWLCLEGPALAQIPGCFSLPGLARPLCFRARCDSRVSGWSGLSHLRAAEQVRAWDDFQAVSLQRCSKLWMCFDAGNSYGCALCCAYRAAVGSLSGEQLDFGRWNTFVWFIDRGAVDTNATELGFFSGCLRVRHQNSSFISNIFYNCNTAELDPLLPVHQAWRFCCYLDSNFKMFLLNKKHQTRTAGFPWSHPRDNWASALVQCSFSRATDLTELLSFHQGEVCSEHLPGISTIRLSRTLGLWV